MQTHKRSAYRGPQLFFVFSYVVTAAILLIGCQQQTPVFTDVERAAVEAEITAARDAYFDAATRFWWPFGTRVLFTSLTPISYH